ncbi:uncharacterized protein LOC134813694 [Bolinopsis microptera]|uniref:uncharacterized protein LOC134813694 n=1 Tax=Bolinopsis microptera TaxID=2820187 RepID=UPI00307A33E0
MKTKDILYKVGKQCMLNDNEMLFLNIDSFKKGKKLFDQVSKMTDIETVPQVFIDETFIGGYPDVKMLHERRYIHEMLLPKPGKKSDGAKEETKFASRLDINNELCPMCVAEEIQKGRLEKRETDLKEKAKDYMLARSAVELARKQLTKHHNRHSHSKKSFMSSFF